MSLKLMSLFDGSGGFPLAASLCGFTPVYASEVEPYPIAVTRSRFPDMVHIGDVSKVNGAELEPVDIISFGSPCQDLSVAGLRKGMKHEENGDDETTRSGLFMEAIRIIREMREATNGKYPTFAIWENVPGAFSSNKGEDFRVVLEAFVKVVEPTAEMPPMADRKWPYADVIVGDGWSIAYRTLDAQHWGVPQRRKRIYLVADFSGERAKEILFERDGLRGYFEESGQTREEAAGHSEDSASSADREGDASYLLKIRSGVERDCYGKKAGKGPLIQKEKSATLGVSQDQYLFTPEVIGVENHPNDSRVKIDESGKCQSLTGRMGTGGGNVPLVMEQKAYSFDSLASNSMKSKNPNSGCREVEISKCLDTTNPDPSKNQGGIAIVEEQDPVYCLQGNGIDRAETAGCNGKGWREDASYTLNTIDRPAVAYATGNGQADNSTVSDTFGALDCMHDQKIAIIGCEAQEKTYIVRRLTPIECARLQGFPDWWGQIDHKEEFTEEEYHFWLDVRKTYDAINGRSPKEYTKESITKWYNNLHTDGAEYKMWGNGIALPCALYVMEGIETER